MSVSQTYWILIHGHRGVHDLSMLFQALLLLFYLSHKFFCYNSAIVLITLSIKQVHLTTFSFRAFGSLWLLGSHASNSSSGFWVVTIHILMKVLYALSASRTGFLQIILQIPRNLKWQIKGNSCLHIEKRAWSNTEVIVA